MALLFLLVPIFISLNGEGDWKNATFVAIVAIAGLAGAYYKVVSPYSWGAADNRPMFEGRQWYRHPLYGAMYIDSELLHFTAPICSTMGEGKTLDGRDIELLSIPFPYTNYFCGIPPWKNYVQTWYDTVTPATVTTLMAQLNTSPPKWILYERQLATLRAHEAEYNNGQPIAHRYLDTMMMQKLDSGQWQLVEKSTYLTPYKSDPADSAWLLIKTRP